MSKAIKIAIVGFEQASCLDISGPAEVFGTANQIGDEADNNRYEVSLYSVDGKAFNTSSNLTLSPEGSISDIPKDTHTLFIAGGYGVETEFANEFFINWIADNYTAFKRVASVCTGSFLLAQAGVLKNKSATTHWQSCDIFKDIFPDVHLDENAIFTQDGNIYTSAGITTGIDLALSLVEDDYGHDTSMLIAKSMVLYLRRSGGQRQFSEILLAQDKNQSQKYHFQKLIDWMQEHISDDITVESMAEQIGMSPRNFSRQFMQSFNTPPMQFLNQLRLEVSRNLIEQEKNSLSEISSICGFKSYETMRRQFTQRYGVGPKQYKKNFALG